MDNPTRTATMSDNNGHGGGRRRKVKGGGKSSHHHISWQDKVRVHACITANRAEIEAEGMTLDAITHRVSRELGMPDLTRNNVRSVVVETIPDLQYRHKKSAMASARTRLMARERLNALEEAAERLADRSSRLTALSTTKSLTC